MSAEGAVIDISEAVERLRTADTSRDLLFLTGGEYTDNDLATMVDCLVANPNVFARIWLNGNRLTDVTGSKLACCVANSTRLELLDLEHNCFSDSTIVGIARAMRTNTTLRSLCVDIQTTDTLVELRRELALPIDFNWYVTDASGHNIKL